MEVQESVKTSCSLEQFVTAVDILISKPQSVNKKLVGSMILKYRLLSQELKFPDLSSSDWESEKDPFRGNLCLQKSCQILRKFILKDVIATAKNEDLLETISWQKDIKSCSVAFCGHQVSPVLACPFRISFSEGCLKLYLEAEKASADPKRIAISIFRSLIKWCSEKSLTKSLPSLRLVPLDEYQKRYNVLKEKYAKKIIQNWSESTDPEKFVHEDVAIATYLCLIWEEEEQQALRMGQQKKKPTFIDLGCGNGLLVFILTGEGYQGTGIDLRKRKIWDSFGDQVDLRVETITPSEDTRFPQYDWLIGNHSDELTPWIPVMTAMSSVTSKFFLLPCCPFEFRSKFQRRNQKVSLYRDYLDYVIKVGEQCGFVMEEDRLRIPSTKRICFLGRTLNYDQENRPEVLNCIKSAILPTSFGGNSSKKLKNNEGVFVPRDTEIKVRNCTKVDKSVTDQIIDLVVKKCLEIKNPLKNLPKDTFLCRVTNPNWNAGDKISLNDIATLFPSELLRQLKSEFGGLQTLFRNNNFIFIVDKGCIRLRCHATDAHSAGKKKATVQVNKFRKKKLCWFFVNHPEGCPILADDCLWAHGNDDLIK